MADYEIGYGKPPANRQFKPGISGNPRGRPKRQSFSLGTIIDGALNSPLKYREGGRMRTATAEQLILKTHIDRAVKGSIKSAEQLLKIRAHAARHGDSSVQRLVISDWLPDFPGQTAEQKAQGMVLGQQDGPQSADGGEQDEENIGPRELPAEPGS